MERVRYNIQTTQVIVLWYILHEPKSGPFRIPVLSGFNNRLVHVFCGNILTEALYFKLKLLLVIHTILWDKKSALTCYKCYS